MNNFWNGFEKRAYEAAFDRSGRESTAMVEEEEKQQQDRPRRDKGNVKEHQVQESKS